MDHVRQTREHIYDDADAPPNMERLGVEVLNGNACFVDPHTIRVENGSGSGRRITSRFFIVAAGSRPKMPAFSEAPLTNETIFELSVQPHRLLVLGAGPAGIEMAQAFVRLGSEVHVVTRGDRILHRDDLEHAWTLQEILFEEGVVFSFGGKVTALEKNGNAFAAVLDDGSTLSCDGVLAAIGREPATQGLTWKKPGS